MKKNFMHPFDKATIREGFDMNIETTLWGIAVAEFKNLDAPATDKLDTTDTREWLLKKAESERFIRSVGTLATLDAAKLDVLVKEKLYSILTADE